VVAIVGILAAIAIPAYQDYTVRAKVSEGLGLAESAKTAIAEGFQSGDAAGASAAGAGWNGAFVATKYVSNININTAAVGPWSITITYAAATPQVSGLTIILTPYAGTPGNAATVLAPGATGNIDWACASTTNATATALNLAGAPKGTMTP